MIKPRIIDTTMQFFNDFVQKPPEGWDKEWASVRISGTNNAVRSVVMKLDSGEIPNWPDDSTNGPVQIENMSDLWWVRKTYDDGKQYLVGESEYDAAAKRLKDDLSGEVFFVD